ncbi:hypothetical protein [Planctomyces sp. SH-PL14]|uniref:hypothetical protein n=1 Tax=Planctomyces sp. SH-PL14 TaxID=1632864 RepID=UPI00078DA009|nr:hypothetical protein [Planctomyces sp. SH-PL14]AMV22053.1 hypothetical protein VT03_29390 [Planctomyces sp. SH-PL14]
MTQPNPLSPHASPSPAPSPAGDRTSMILVSRRDCLTLLFGASALSFSGCVNALAMATKMIQGDPMTTAGFTVATGVDLAETGSLVAAHVSCPTTMTRNYATLTFDIEQELRERMRRNDVQCVNPNEVSNILDAKGLQFDPKLIARTIKDVEYVFHIHIESFKLHVDNSPTLLQGMAHGTISGYAIDGGNPDGDKKKKAEKTAKAESSKDDNPSPRTAIQIYEKEFLFEHPRNHPIPIDQTPVNAFRRKFVNKLADHLGNQFYPVKTIDLI